MTLYCHLQLKALKHINYNFEWKEELRKTVSELLIIEADNHSDPFLIQESAKLIGKTSQLICCFEVEEESTLGSISRILEAILRSEARQLIFLKGRNESLEKALKFIKTPCINFKDSQELIFEIQQFVRA